MNNPTPNLIVFEIPLYDQIKYTDEEREGDSERIKMLLFEDTIMDGPCPGCGKETTYLRKGSSGSIDLDREWTIPTT